jgi:hypothetical protein
VPADVRAGPSAATTIDRDGTFRYSVAAPTAVGCYRAQPELTLVGAGGDTLPLPTEASRPVYRLHPTLTAEVERTWAVSPAAVPVRVSVDGLFGLAAHVRTTMYAAAADPGGCARATFADAARTATGPAAAIPATPGMVSVAVNSGPTPKVGCYAVVPELTIDAAPSVRVAGAVGVPGSTLIAGIDPNQGTKRPAQRGATGNSVAFVVTMCVVGGLMLAVAARVGLLAWRERNGPLDDPWAGWREPDPLGLTDDGIPSGA